MKKNQRVFQVGLLVVLALSVLASLVVKPVTGAHAEAPTPIPTKMSNTLISAQFSKATVNPGDSFDINILINTDTPSWGLQFALKFDPTLVEVDSKYDQGGYYKDYAAAHNGTFLVFPTPVVDNTAGTIKTTGLALVGLPINSGGPTGSGTLLVFHAKAKSGASGIARFIFSDVVVSDTGDATGNTAALGGVRVQDGALSVGSSSAAPTEAPRAAGSDAPQAGPTPTAEPTIAKRTSLSGGNADNSGGPIPWMVIVPVVGLAVIGGGVFVVTRKK